VPVSYVSAFIIVAHPGALPLFSLLPRSLLWSLPFCLLTHYSVLVVGSLNIVIVVGVYSFLLLVASLSHDRKMLAVAPIWLTMDGSSNVSRAPRVGHKKSRKGCAQCKRRHVKVGFIRGYYHFRNGRIRLTSIRFRNSATRNHHVQTVYGIASRALLLGGRMSLETMPKRSNNGVQLHQYPAIRPEHHHTISPA